MLHITQPTLSRQLSDLEAELGVRLFERGSHKIHLTQDGLLLKRSAQEIADLEEKARAQFSPDAGGISGVISFGCGELASMDALAEWLADFRAEAATETKAFSAYMQVSFSNAKSVPQRKVLFPLHKTSPISCLPKYLPYSFISSSVSKDCILIPLNSLNLLLFS